MIAQSFIIIIRLLFPRFSALPASQSVVSVVFRQKWNVGSSPHLLYSAAPLMSLPGPVLTLALGLTSEYVTQEVTSDPPFLCL